MFGEFRSHVRVIVRYMAIVMCVTRQLLSSMIIPLSLTCLLHPHNTLMNNPLPSYSPDKCPCPLPSFIPWPICFPASPVGIEARDPFPPGPDFNNARLGIRLHLGELPWREYMHRQWGLSRQLGLRDEQLWCRLRIVGKAAMVQTTRVEWGAAMVQRKNRVKISYSANMGLCEEQLFIFTLLTQCYII